PEQPKNSAWAVQGPTLFEVARAPRSLLLPLPLTTYVTPMRLPSQSSPYGSRTRLCTVKGCRPEPIDERAVFLCFANSGNGIRTRVPALRGPCPRPLDDTAKFCARTRTRPFPSTSRFSFQTSNRPGGT